MNLNDTLVGQDIGGYRVLRQIGEGGMGVVYLGEHKLIERQAAIKILHPEFSKRADVVSRFFNEAKASARLKHPAIIEIYDFGKLPDDSAYIVMEFLEGEPLTDLVERLGRLPTEDAVAITHQMLRALAAAHDKGIVHRDLKPDNIFIVPDPENPGFSRVKILDFGIAKLTDDGKGGLKKTKTGAVLGTPLYMSPEQCAGAGYVDHRSDIYSMGIIFYEMLCGEVPFNAEGFGLVLAMHMTKDPASPRKHVPEIAPEVEAVVLKMLAKEKDDRYQTCDEVTQALEDSIERAPLFSTPAETVPDVPSFRRPTRSTLPSSPNLKATPAPGALAEAKGPAVLGSAATVADDELMSESDPAARPLKKTTLSSGATEAPLAPAPRRRGWVAGAIAAVVVLGVAAGMVAVLAGRDDGGTSERDDDGADDRRSSKDRDGDRDGDRDRDKDDDKDDATAAPETAAASAVAETAAPKPGVVELKITSEPTGAMVYRMPKHKLVGETPWSMLVKPRDEALEFSVEKRGFTKGTATVDGSGGEAHVTLEKKVGKKAGTDDFKPVGRDTFEPVR